MELDLSKLDKLYKFDNKDKATENVSPNLDKEAQKEAKPYNHTTKDKNPLDSELELVEAASKLQVFADQKKREIELKTAEKHRKNNNYISSTMLQTEIAKGILKGEDIYILFIKAIEVIKLLSDTTAFSNQAKEDIIKIYGRGLNYKKPLQVEQEEAKTRLNNLVKALDRENDTKTKARIKTAIKAHKELIEELQNRIEETKDGTN